MPEAHGGVGMSAEAACVLAEEAGRSLAPVPLVQALAATEALLALGTAEQQARWLPGIADGSVVAVTGWAEGGDGVAGGRRARGSPAARSAAPSRRSPTLAAHARRSSAPPGPTASSSTSST